MRRASSKRGSDVSAFDVTRVYFRILFTELQVENGRELLRHATALRYACVCVCVWYARWCNAVQCCEQ